MKRSLLGLGFFFFSTALTAATLRGFVRDPYGHALAGASVTVESRTATTDDSGAFALDVPAGLHTVRTAHAGFQSQSRDVSTSDVVEITLVPAFAETMVVSAIRAEPATPVTKSEVTRDDIAREYHGEDVPLLLRDTPSITAYAESGSGGAGYSYISLRGVSPTRINFTLDGVPLADSEDFGTYFVDFPDLARSVESIQVQRGVGTSTVGSPSFGGSVNLESVTPSGSESVGATLGGGSFGSRQATAAYHSGTLDDRFAFYTRASFLETGGFRDNSATRQHNLFFSGTANVGSGRLELTGFSGHEQQQLSFYATDEDTLRTDLRANPLRPEEKDSFGYDLAQLQYIRPVGEHSDFTASAYYQRGYGWYRLFDEGTDVLRQYGLDGRLIGTMLTWSRSAGAVTMNYGVHANRFVRDHTSGEVGADEHDYANYGVKDEINAFAKIARDVDRWHLYGDAQVRRSRFAYHGDVAIEPISWTFFNPKAGARYDLTASSSVYASAGLSTREPTRNDLFLGEDNATIAHDLHAVRPERLADFEAGWTYRAPRINISADVYAMEFHNEIAATGELSDIGLALRRNVDRSSRRGVEIDATWQAARALRSHTTASLSRNRIDDWTQFYDVYDDSGVWSGSRATTYRNVEPLLTPSTVVNQTIDFNPSSRFTAGVTGRWVARSFLDNTDNPAFIAPSFFTLDGGASYALTSSVRLSVHASNLLNNRRVYPSGYSYLYYSGDVLTGTSYYYPQATRNAVVLLDFNP